MNAHCDVGNVDVGRGVYRHIIENEPFSSSDVSYWHLTKGSVDARRIAEAMGLHREMLNKGYGADSLVYNNLILWFLMLGNLEKSNELFDKLKERCLVYNGIVSANLWIGILNKGRIGKL